MDDLMQRAESGDSIAQFELAMHYWVGVGGQPQNYSVGLKWMKKAALGGNGEASLQIGRFYAYGQGVQQNFPEAEMWLEMGVSQGSEAAKILLANIRSY